MMDFESIRFAIFVLVVAGQTLFAVLYATYPWYRTPLGRALFFKSITFTFFLNVAVAGRLWDWRHEDVWVTTGYGLAALGIWGQLAAFLSPKLTPRSSNKGKHRDRTDRSE